MAVQDLEAAKIIHRDIKPENVIEAKDGMIKLIDLGICREFNETGNLTEGTGTGPYIPPEGCGTKHDIYSTAVVWFELMTNRLPMYSSFRTKAALAHSFMIETTEVNDQVIDLFFHMIEPDADVRWTAAQASPAMTRILEALSKGPKPNIYRILSCTVS